MKKSTSIPTRAAIPLAVCLLMLAAMGVARAADKSRLSGHWNFNTAESDDADRKVHEAQINNTRTVDDGNGGASNPTAGTGYPGGGGVGGGIGYPTIGGMGGRGGMGGIGGGGMGRGGRQGTRGPEVTDEEWERLAENPKYLVIDQTGRQVVVSTDADTSQTFYPDGKKHEDRDSGGRKITTKTDWEGDVLIAETRVSRAQKITQSFRLSSDGRQLYVTSEFEDTSLKGPVSIRRVYDLGKTPAQ